MVHYTYQGVTNQRMLNQDELQCLEAVNILANSAGSGKMSHSVAFNLGPHCFPKYLCRVFQNAKV